MTVAAVILAASPVSALADADGLPRVRREADAAWAGGATPVVVVAHDPEGAVSAALTGSEAMLAEAAPLEAGPAGQIARGLEVAGRAVRETEAALVWPARMAWVDPETVTSLIEAHGADRDALIRPSYGGEPGWPLVVPLPYLDAIRAVPPDRMPDGIVEELVRGGAPLTSVELGDPGTVIDGDRARADLPDYQGPPRPPADHVHEWGEAVADAPEEGPAPVRVPYEGG